MHKNHPKGNAWGRRRDEVIVIVYPYPYPFPGPFGPVIVF